MNTVEHTMYASVYIIAYIACGSASLYIKTLYFFLTVLALSAAATIANIKIRYDAKTPQFAIFGTRIICVFYSTSPNPYPANHNNCRGVQQCSRNKKMGEKISIICLKLTL